MRNGKQRRILLAGQITTTSDKPEYILGLFDKKNNLWYYVLKNEIRQCYCENPRRVVVSRYTKEQIEHEEYIKKRFAPPGSLYSKLKRIPYKEFKGSVKANASRFQSISSVDSWLKYSKKELSQEFKIDKLKQLISPRLSV